MNYAEICIIKRDGKREDFSISKIKNAIGKAFHASGIDNEDKLIAEITMRVISNFVSPTISVEEIQDLVEKELMKYVPKWPRNILFIANGGIRNATVKRK